LKLRLTRIAQKLGFTATPEHAPTHSDVFVHEPQFCLEVQLVPTQFSKRTAARHGKGAGVCWFIREGLDTPKALKALFELPAVRFRIVDRSNPKVRLVAPWEAPGDGDLAYHARLQAFGTVAHAPPRNQRPDPSGSRATWFRTGSMDGYQFLREILTGQRRWHPPNALGHRSGLWALDTDVTEYHEFRNQQRARRFAPAALRPAVQHTSTNGEISTPTAEIQPTMNPLPETEQAVTEADPPTVSLPAIQHIPYSPLAVHESGVSTRTAPLTPSKRQHRWRWLSFWKRKR
jgi:hypothetical protein